MRTATAALSALAFACAAALPASAACSASVEIGKLVYDPLALEATQLPGAVDLRCTGLTQPTTMQVSISAGVSGDPAHRTLVSDGPDVLRYAILLADGTPWGDGLGGAAPFTVSVVGRHARIPFVAVVPPHQLIGEGVYGDDLTVTLEY